VAQDSPSIRRKHTLLVWLLNQPTTDEFAGQAEQLFCDCDLHGEIWIVVRDAGLAPGTLTPVSAPAKRCQILSVSSDWGHGAIRKLFCRKVVRDGFDQTITVAGGNERRFFSSDLLRCLTESTAELVSIVAASSRGQSLNSQDLSSDQLLIARCYRRSLLSRIPFELNDDGDQFDDDLGRQTRHIQATHETRVVDPEPPVSTLPAGSRLRRRIAELQFHLHSLGIWCSLKYRDLTPARYRDKSDTLYSSHQLAIFEVSKLKGQTLLDLGCGPGFVARQCRKLGIHVHGVDVADPLPDTVSEFTRCNLDHGPYPFDIWNYDVVLLLDVIEHLSTPEQFLLDLRHRSECPDVRIGENATPRPCIILTTPNIAFAAIRLGLLLGRFNYADRGILDLTHRRLFTRRSLCTAIRSSGYDIELIRPVPAPFAAILPGRMGIALNWLAAVAARVCPGWFAFQWLVRCRPRPGVGHLPAATQPTFGEIPE